MLSTCEELAGDPPVRWFVICNACRLCVHVSTYIGDVLAMYRSKCIDSLAALEVVRVGIIIQDVRRVRGHLHPVHAVLDVAHLLPVVVRASGHDAIAELLVPEVCNGAACVRCVPSYR